ncbi:MAG TPA: hypothetical protein VJU16_05035 [Planctomycetota bacterium]|nr:hypothetical protein [Planctomycetota bacterium]
MTGQVKKLMQTEESRGYLRMGLEAGVRLDLMIENYYRQGKDGKLTIDPGMGRQMIELFSHDPK